MKGIRWAEAAADGLENIWKYLIEHHPSYVRGTIQKIYDAGRSLRNMPGRGRSEQMSGTRELVLSPLPYVLVYRVDENFVSILRVLHGMRNR